MTEIAFSNKGKLSRYIFFLTNFRETFKVPFDAELNSESNSIKNVLHKISFNMLKYLINLLHNGQDVGRENIDAPLEYI